MKKLIWLLLTLGCGSVQAAGVVTAEDTWTDGNGHHYAVVRFSGITWQEAQQDMASLLPDGYHLATVTSQAEQDFIVQLVNQSGYFSDYWLGGFQVAEPDMEPDGGWQWVTGEDWVYTSWRSGEPNNANGNENYLTYDGPAGWNDCCTTVGNTVNGGYIAEVVPIPAAAYLFASGLGLLGWFSRKARKAKQIVMDWSLPPDCL